MFRMARVPFLCPRATSDKQTQHRYLPGSNHFCHGGREYQTDSTSPRVRRSNDPRGQLLQHGVFRMGRSLHHLGQPAHLYVYGTAYDDQQVTDQRQSEHPGNAYANQEGDFPILIKTTSPRPHQRPPSWDFELAAPSSTPT